MIARGAAVLLASTFAVAVTSIGGLADTATADLVPGPPAGSWEVSADDTHSMTAGDLYGTRASSVHGFADAYQKAWTSPGLVLFDRLERFTSVFWADYRFAGAQSATRNTAHSSYTALPGLGTRAYEFTDPPDADGFSADTIVAVQGDYLAVLALDAQNATPDRSLVLDQARRQLDLVPIPTAEYTAIGSGVLTAAAVIIGAAVVVALVVGAIILVVVLRRRRAPPVHPRLTPAGIYLSPDRLYWWDGASWQDATARLPPGAALSPDGTMWWDGAAWRPSPPRTGAGG